MRRNAASTMCTLAVALAALLVAAGTAPAAELEDRLVFSSDRDVQPDLDLFSLGVRDRDLRKLTDSPEWDEYEPQASHDGTQVVFVRTPAGRRWPSHLPADLWVMRADGSGLARITETPEEDEWDPTLSPDGRQVAFVLAHGDSSALWLANIEGSDRREVVRTEGHVETPAWSPDGRRIAYGHCVSPCLVAEVWVADVDGEKTAQLSDPRPTLGWDHRPSWSPDGREILFGRQTEDLDWEIWRMNADGSDERQLTAEPLYVNQGADYSIDGSSIAFIRWPSSWAERLREASGELFEEAGVWVMRSDGSEPRLLTKPSSPWDDGRPQWTRVDPELMRALKPAPAIAAATAPAPPTAGVRIRARRLCFSRRGVVRIGLHCVSTARAPCRGRVEIWANALLGSRVYTLPANERRTVAVRISVRGRRLAMRPRGTRVEIVAVGKGLRPVSRRAYLRTGR